MANPQPDKFTKISTELLEALYRIRIPGEAMQVLLFIIRKTYGYKKKGDYIAGSQISEGTGIVRQNVVRALHKLKQMNMIIVIKKDSPSTAFLMINKDYETWVNLPKKSTAHVIEKDSPPAVKDVIKKDSHVIEKDYNLLSKKIHTIDKKIILKDTGQESDFEKIKNKYAEAFYILHFFALTMDAAERKRYLPNKKSEKQKYNWINTLKLFHTIDKYPWWKIFDVIYHARVVDDHPRNGGDFCWKDQVLTIPALRTLSRSQGIYKFHVIHNKIEKDLEPPKGMTDLEYITKEMEKYAKQKE